MDVVQSVENYNKMMKTSNFLRKQNKNPRLVSPYEHRNILETIHSTEKALETKKQSTTSSLIKPEKLNIHMINSNIRKNLSTSKNVISLKSLTNLLVYKNSNSRNKKDSFENINTLISCYNANDNENQYYYKNMVNYDKNFKNETFEKFKIKNKIDTELKKEKIILLPKKSHSKDFQLSSESIKVETHSTRSYFKGPLNSFKKLCENKHIFEKIEKIMKKEEELVNVENLINRKIEFDKKKENLKKIKISISPHLINTDLEAKFESDFNSDKESVKLFTKENFRPLRKNIQTQFTKQLELHCGVILYQSYAPVSRSQSSTVVFDNKMFIIGGIQCGSIENLPYFDFSTYSWSSLKYNSSIECPLARFGHTSVYFKGEFYIFGGMIGTNMYPYKDDILVFDTTRNYFQFEKTFNKSEMRFRRNHTSTIIGTNMLVYGGIDENDEFLNDMWVLDLISLRWSPLEITPKNIKIDCLAYHSSTLAINLEKKYHESFNLYRPPDLPSRINFFRQKTEGIYFFGGIDGDRKIKNELKFLQIGKKPVSYSVIKSNGISPRPRMCSSLNYNEELHILAVFGGKDDEVFFNDLFVFILDTYTWNKVLLYDKIPEERAEHCAEFIGSKLVIFGGISIKTCLGSELQVISFDYWERKRKKMNIKINQISEK